MYKKKDKFEYYLKEKISNNLFFTIFVFIFALIILTIIFSIIVYNPINNVDTATQEDMQKFNEEIFSNKFGYIWNNIHTLVNGWWPEVADLEKMTLIMVAFKSIIAIAGILLTSTLIGFITEYISNKIGEIRNRNFKIYEENHIVILGYYYGETKLIEEIIKYVGNNKIVIVIADKKEKNNVLEDIKCNIDIPRNVKIIIRSIDFTDPNY